MGGTTKGFSLLSGKLGLFQPRPRKTSKTAARRGGARALARKSAREGKVQASPWQAAEIQFREACACDAVRKFAGKRFLVREVPTIPVPDCDSNECKCTYVRHKDRRAGDDRRAYFGLQTQLYGTDDGRSNRRKKRGRRATDKDADTDLFDISIDDIKFY